MKAVGYTTCRTCEGTYRGYKPRHWRPGDELATWQHGLEDGMQHRCPGSYKIGINSRLDGQCPPGGHSWDVPAGQPAPAAGQRCKCGAEPYAPREVG